MFIDEVVISIKAGHGGAGAVSFRRDRSTQKGGPDGGDGGKGGNVIFTAQRNESTLLKFRYEKNFDAERGGSGSGNNKHGKNGEDVSLVVPCGTVIKNEKTGETLCDLTDDMQEYTAAKGGRGGKGNDHFKSATYQAPKFAQPGEDGGQLKLRLILKLLADVGLVGLPNAGKSTLISRMTAAKPAIADYPFTTLSPKLGVVQSGENSFVMADMPGLIEGAHHGKGLGTQFLKHIERTAVICHLVDVTDPSAEKIKHDFDTISTELGEYDPTLIERRKLVLLTKTDTLSSRDELKDVEKLFAGSGLEVLPISAVAGENIDLLSRKLNGLVKEVRNAQGSDSRSAEE